MGLQSLPWSPNTWSERCQTTTTRRPPQRVAKLRCACGTSTSVVTARTTSARTSASGWRAQGGSHDPHDPRASDARDGPCVSGGSFGLPTPDSRLHVLAVLRGVADMSMAYDMHAKWRERNPREVLARCRAHGGTITPYARDPGRLRSFIVSWSVDGCEGHLYVLRCKPLRRDVVRL